MTAQSSEPTNTRRAPDGAGGKNPPGEPADHALGRSRGGFGTKVHLVTDGRGLPLALYLTGGQRQECEVLEPVLEAVRIRRPRGRPRQRPEALTGDKAYSFPRLRRWLRAHHVRAVIPERRDQQDRRRHRPGRRLDFDRAAYRQRNVIERAVGWLKERRRIATRDEKLAIQYLAMLYVGLLEKYLLAPLTLCGFWPLYPKPLACGPTTSCGLAVQYDISGGRTITYGRQ